MARCRIGLLRIQVTMNVSDDGRLHRPGVMEQLGHSSIGITMNVFIGARPSSFVVEHDQFGSRPAEGVGEFFGLARFDGQAQLEPFR